MPLELPFRLRVEAKLILLVLAFYADDEGRNAWPSVATISNECEMGVRTTDKVLRLLAKQGFIAEQAKPQRHRPRTWMLNMDRLGPQHSCESTHTAGPQHSCDPASVPGAQELAIDTQKPGSGSQNLACRPANMLPTIRPSDPSSDSSEDPSARAVSSGEAKRNQERLNKLIDNTIKQPKTWTDADYENRMKFLRGQLASLGLPVKATDQPVNISDSDEFEDEGDEQDCGA